MMDKYGADLLYGIGSPSYLVAPAELFDGDESRVRLAFESDPGFRPGSCSSAISDVASAVAAELRRGGSDEVSDGVRGRIASHRLFPELLQAYVDCRKVGAPAEIANELEEIRRENNKLLVLSSTYSFAGANSDTELDNFMESYCEILRKYKTDLSRPFEEATSFLSEMQAQLNHLCSPGASTSYVSDEAADNSSEEELSGGEIELTDISPVLTVNEDRELKEKLLRKYSGYISSLKHEFSKTKKKGKLPKEARQALLDWWTLHYRWPYPTEGDKIALGELSGLDQKQINNWFINQRKRHWKPPENLHVAIMEPHSLNYAPFYNQ